MYSGNNLLYILTVLEAIEKISIFVSKFKDAPSFFKADDQLYFHAVNSLLLAVGEESKKLESDLKKEFEEIPWSAIAGMRNRLAHDYRGIDFNLVFSTATVEIPILKSVLIKMLKMIDYDKGELNAALNSTFYKHLNYLREV